MVQLGRLPRDVPSQLCGFMADLVQAGPEIAGRLRLLQPFRFTESACQEESTALTAHQARSLSTAPRFSAFRAPGPKSL